MENITTLTKTEKAEKPEIDLFFDKIEKSIINTNGTVQFPYIDKVLFQRRKMAFKEFQDRFLKEGDPDFQDNLRQFVKKFEKTYLDELRNAIKPYYALELLRQGKDIPLSAKEREGLSGADLCNLLEEIAAWMIEVESLAYTIEGLRLYGFDLITDLSKTGILADLNQKPTPSTTYLGKVGSMVNRLILSILSSFGKTILDAFMKVVQAQFGEMVTKSLTLLTPMLVNGLSSLSGESEGKTDIKEIQGAYEARRIELMSKRQTLYKMLRSCLALKDELALAKQKEVILDLVSKILKKEIEKLYDPEGVKKQLEILFQEREEEDYCVIEDRGK